MSWPTEYRVTRTKQLITENPVELTNGATYHDGLPYEIMSLDGLTYNPEWVACWSRLLRRIPRLGQPETVTAEHGDRVLARMSADYNQWPDGAVDFFAELVCIDGWIVEGRTGPSAKWVRLEPGFKEADHPRRRPGRPRRTEGRRERERWERIKAVRAEHPEWTDEQVAERVDDIDLKTLRRYERDFSGQ